MRTKPAVNILIVDDRPENLLTLEAVLRSPRYKLIKALSGSEALELLPTREFALIILDVQMPHMDGFEVARRIKRQPQYRDIPIIFITAISKDSIHVFKGYETGAIDYLTKPFEDYVLQSKVAVIVELYEKNLEIAEQQHALALANGQMRQEVLERKRAEIALRQAQAGLELKVSERTAALESSNRALQLEILERRRAEARLQASLQEKEVLLKEIHHRVKNNLQVISSLLSLQSDHIEDERMLALFEESRDRIRSMALVHETLYTSTNLSSIDMALYIQRLATQLARSYAKDGVQVRAEVEAVALNIDTAVPCGLLLNELVSNALKHAFPDGQVGHVAVRLQRLPGGGLRFQVEDNGVGIAADISPATTPSLGLRLVDALSQQLGASVCLDRARGTTFTIDVPRIEAAAGPQPHPPYAAAPLAAG
jgi:two-component sensor histidine kinase/DNA-binding NarL/FixJ family response regulator